MARARWSRRLYQAVAIVVICALILPPGLTGVVAAPPPVISTGTSVLAAALPLTETLPLSPAAVLTPTDVLTLTDIPTEPTLPVAEPAPSTFVSPLPTPPAPVAEDTAWLAQRPQPSAQTLVLAPEGGRLATSDNVVTLDFPAKAIEAALELDVQVLIPEHPYQANGELRWLTLDVTPRDPARAVDGHLRFAQPVTLTFDLTGFPAWLQPYLVHQVDAEKEQWERVTAIYSPTAQTLTAQVDTFSVYGVGGESGVYAGWALTYNAPTVALFRGAATYNYPIALPPARGQLNPTLNLSYNSSRVDGLLGLVDSEWTGLGWSIDTVDIVRDKVSYTWADNFEWLNVSNRFNLLLNGSGYELEPATPGQTFGRYYAKHAPQLYVEYKSSGAANLTGQYWIVRTAEGTEYRLGYTLGSEQIVCKVYPTNNEVYRWRLDQATDMFGNQMALTYREAHSGEGYGCSRDTASVLDRIYYNKRVDNGQWGTEIRLIPTSYTFENVPNWNAPPIFSRQGQLARLEIWQNGQRQTYYQLTHITYAPVSSYPYEGQVRELRAIQQWSGDGTQALPATTFTYQSLPNKTTCCCSIEACGNYHKMLDYAYPRLSAVANGYGAHSEFSYENDGRVDNNALFYNYRVTEQRTYDGLQAQPAKVTYTYGTRCYDQSGSATNGGTLCRGRAPENVGPLAGHADVTVRAYDYNGSSLLTKSQHLYYTDDNNSWRLGREYQMQTYFDDTTVAERVDTVWGVAANGTTTFAYTDRVTTTQYFGGVTTKNAVDYDYDGYGNVVAEYQYGAAGASGDERSIHRKYYPNTAAWIVSRVARESVYEGIRPDDNDTGTLQSRTRYRYDNQVCWNLPPGAQGRLTAVDRWFGPRGGTPDDCYWPDYDTTTYTYDTWGNVTAATDPNGNTTTTNYETTYRQFPTWVRRHTGSQYLYSYTRYYGVNEEVRGDDFGLFGQVQKTYDSNGEAATATYSVYDAFGRLVKAVRPGDSFAYPTVEYTYADAYVGGGLQGLRVVSTQRETSGSSANLPVVTFYDGLGRAVQQRTEYQEGSAQSVVNTVYDAVGRAVTAYVPEAESFTWAFSRPSGWNTRPRTQTAYDALGRATVVTAPDNTATQMFYQGRKTIVLDAANQQRFSRVDAYGQLVEVKEYLTTYTSPNWTATAYATTTYAYDTLGNLTTVTDTLGNVTTMQYDKLSRKTAMNDPDMGQWYYYYDNAGNLIAQVDARQQATNSYYDILNRLRGKTYATANTPAAYVRPVDPGYSGYTVKYYYDESNYGYSIGYRTRMVDPSGSAAWTYDTRGRVTQETKGINGGGTFTTQWGYDSLDRVTWMKYPGGNTGGLGEQVTYTYTAQGALNSVSSSLSPYPYVQSTAYDAAGRIVTRVFSNTTFATQYTYYPWTTANGQGRLQQVKSGTPSDDDSLQKLAYTYDAVGNVRMITDTLAGPQTQIFTYDELDRLKTARATGGSGGIYITQTYSYNQIGNLLNNGDGALTYDAQLPSCPDNALNKSHAAVSSHGNTRTYCYDANGNQVRRTISGSISNLTYDAENRLTTVSGATSASFTYDGDGNRVKSVMGGVTTYYVGNYFEWTGSTTSMVKYYYAGSQRVAMRKGSSTLHFLLGDHLGSTSLTASSSGSKVAELRYHPWGGTRYTSGATPTSYQFTGQRNDSYIGLYFYNVRMYDPALGRFLSADTIVPSPQNPQSLNRYSYVLNLPLRYTDPTGHMYQPALILGEPDHPVSSPLTEFYGLSWEYDDDVPFDARDQAGRDELWTWFDEHSDYDPATDPVMQNPEYYGVHWGPATSDVQAFYNEWQWKNSDRPLKNAGQLLATSTALGAFYVVQDLKSSDVGIWATWVGPELPHPSQPIPLSETEWVGWEARGPSYWNKDMKVSLYPEPVSPHGPHWDYTQRNGPDWRIYPNGRMELK